MRALVILALLLVLPLAGPASADEGNLGDDLPLASPKPLQNGRTPIEVAQLRVRSYLSTVPGVPKDVIVVPATGLVPWPLAPLEKDIRAEVWTVVPRVGEGVGPPILMFAVRTDTGEVFAMFVRDIQKEPTFQ
jgi:hypothetical protein